MFLLTICLLVAAALLGLRYSIFLSLRRSNCPKCKSDSFIRKKRTRLDRGFAKLFGFPIERYRCNHYRCGWVGPLIYKPQKRSASVKPDINLIQRQNLYFSTSSPKNGFRNAPEWLVSEASLTQALKRNEFELYYQSTFNFETKNITGVEALLRWKHPDRGLIYPAEFIPLADEHDFIFSLGRWMLTQACLQVLQWHAAGLYPLRVSINLSVRQFYQPGLIDTITQALGNTGLNPRFLEIEVTENTVMQNLDLASIILRELHDIGVRVTMDNFGVGNTPRRYLRRMALNALKLDQSLVRNLKRESDSVEVIRSFVRLAQSLILDVVATGVETREQLSLIRSLDCKLAQGYLFDVPISAEDTTDVLQANWLGRKESALSSAG
jgi:EAL domain-containing protein (putative c-di-GMP-specific phosphodiesterase class I)